MGVTISSLPLASTLTGAELAPVVQSGVTKRIAISDVANLVLPIDTADVSDSAITTAKIADSNVTTDKIANANVTPAKLSTGGPSWTTDGTLAVTGTVAGNPVGTIIQNTSSSADSSSTLFLWNDNGLSATNAQINFYSSSASHSGVSANEMRLFQSSNAPMTFWTNGVKRLNLAQTGDLTSVSGAVGYGAGAGGIVFQATSKATNVTLNKPSGVISMNNAALAANTTVAFTVNNTFVTETDSVVINIRNASVVSAASYLVWAAPLISGGFIVCLRNITAGSLSEAVALSYSVIKGAAS